VDSSPALSPIQGPELPGAPEEPVLEVDEIQGNILVGFNKDFQAFVFLQILDVVVAKRWLSSLVPRVATTAETLAARRLFRALRARRAEASIGLITTWLNVAFTAEGIKKLTSEADAAAFPDQAFQLGLAERSELLGDPSDPTHEGHRRHWVVGNERSRPDILLIIASDSRRRLQAEVNGVLAEMERMSGRAGTAPASKGLRLLCEPQYGAVFSGRRRGHEHFGFKDGISQPGIRGRASPTPLDFLTPRMIDPAHPLALRLAKPGQPLIWPGQFVLGYPRQAPNDDLTPHPVDFTPTPAWTRNGSYLVFRRLRQKVAAFWRFATEQAERLAAVPEFSGMTAERFASLLVGRWPSGAPIMRSPDRDDQALSAHPLADNDFQFFTDAMAIPLLPTAPYPPDTFPRSPADAAGVRCPFAAHVRKVNPRDEPTDLGSARRTLQLRILRRGIPYGKAVRTRTNPSEDATDRGLLFVSYQSSIEDQFEMLMHHWANSMEDPKGYSDLDGYEVPAGHDPLIGQRSTDADPSRVRVFTLPRGDGRFETIRLPQDWVVPTGGDYFFAPSISALKDVLAAG
jgi:Dyp-type peroxidase family